MLPVEDSILGVDSPPSSPFVTEVAESKSRSSSKQFNKSSLVQSTVAEDATVPEDASSPQGEKQVDFGDAMTDKENVACIEEVTTKLDFSPKKSIALEKASQPVASESNASSPDGRRRSADLDLMPPPSTRRTPKRSPLKASRSVGNAAAPLSRGNSYESVEGRPQHATAPVHNTSDVQPAQDSTSVDDTCFSNFSEMMPELTQWAKLNQSPSKRMDETGKLRTPLRDEARTPRTSRKRPSPSRSPSPTPRRQRTPGPNADGTQTFLIDFTQQIEGLGRGGHISPSRTEPNLLQYLNGQRSPAKTTRHSIATPARQSNILNLLDFELPPAPTPRSVPTITVRELETLKSSYLSQISSLKATLSGREAEVESLKRAVSDAESRVGEAQEALREEKSRREHVEQEKKDWERRGVEVENVLKSVKDEVLKGEAEKEELVRRMEESERGAEEAEDRARKAEERFADTLAARLDGDGDIDGDGARGQMEEQVQRLVAVQIDAKIEAVSRELHGVYKEKHERKVATLKKSYEARSEKRCADLQARVTELEMNNEELVAAKDATFSGQLPEAPAGEHDAGLKVQMEEQKAHLARLEEELLTSRVQQDELVQALEQERIEKGDLVAAVDEMLVLQAEQGPTQGAMSVVEDFRKSISRRPSAIVSGLRPPGETKIGKAGLVARTPAAGKSRMLANIERMGRTASRE